MGGLPEWLVNVVVEEAVQAESFPVESDLLPRIADYYLADPERYGVLYREISRWFEVPGLERRWPDAVWDAIGRGDWGPSYEWYQRWHRAALEAVGGDEEILRERRADAVWVDETGPEPLIEVHEIKVQESTLVAELCHPAKSAAWMQVAHRFWLSVPWQDLVEGHTIPPEWGIMLLPYGEPAQVLREAPLLRPTAQLRASLGRTRLTVASRPRSGPAQGESL